MNSSFVSVVRILLIVVFIAAAIMLVIRVPKLIFSDSAQAGEDTCGDDPNYYYKDPTNYPYGC